MRWTNLEPLSASQSGTVAGKRIGDDKNIANPPTHLHTNQMLQGQRKAAVFGKRDVHF
jgi:hypothetical protein